MAPRILVVNDDGIESTGIVVLAEALAALGDVTVVAPDGDRSGASHSITTRRPVSSVVRSDRSVRSFACSGTPADCVILGVNDLCGAPPDFVVSGINRGANLADDINYSGTVAGAVEAAFVGIPAIAVSLAASWPEEDPVHHWQTAANVACDLLTETLREPLPPGSYWNVNVPNVDAANLRGLRYTRQGRKQYTERLARAEGDRAFYWVWSFPKADQDDDTDIAAVTAGYVSVTPLRIDRTDVAVLKRWNSRRIV